MYYFDRVPEDLTATGVTMSDFGVTTSRTQRDNPYRPYRGGTMLGVKAAPNLPKGVTCEDVFLHCTCRMGAKSNATVEDVIALEKTQANCRLHKLAT
jgi:hypothetical protein